jgi:hypothetical protein
LTCARISSSLCACYEAAKEAFNDGTNLSPFLSLLPALGPSRSAISSRGSPKRLSRLLDPAFVPSPQAAGLLTVIRCRASQNSRILLSSLSIWATAAHGRGCMFCLKPELKKVPRGNWYCPRCTRELPQKDGKITASSTADDVKCQRCELLFRNRLMSDF